MIEGQLVVEVSGVRHQLGVGDSCYFHSSLPHRYLNLTEEPVDFVIAVTPPSY
ncbi:cupin domain-containing protein [Streptosporangium lutulentum]